MALDDLQEDPDYEGCCGEFEEEDDETTAQDDISDALVILEDARELFIALLDPKLWDTRYITQYLRREIEKMEAEILTFTNQWSFPETKEPTCKEEES